MKSPSLHAELCQRAHRKDAVFNISQRAHSKGGIYKRVEYQTFRRLNIPVAMTYKKSRQNPFISEVFFCDFHNVILEVK